jgi:signal transduction histidine kinase
LRGYPLLADGLLAVVLAGACLWATRVAWSEIVAQAREYPQLAEGIRPPDIWGAALDLLATLPLALRRRRPVVAAAVVAAAAAGNIWLGYPSLSLLPLLFAAYALGAYAGLRRGVPWLCAATVALAAAELAGGGSHGVSNVVITPVIAAVSWWVGRSVLLRRAYTAELEDRARRLERARDVYARAALAEERSRIARELHDVVAHHVSVMTVQASAAKRVLDRDPDRAREALTAVESTGRSAMAEMRRLVGVLRTDGHDDAERPAAARGPQPGIADIAELVHQTREAGLNVVLRTEGAPRTLATGADLAAYRVAQEALTNTLKHAGASVHARITITYTARDVTIAVDDDGAPEPEPARASAPERPGHGLVGMRERVALYGGDLRTGPRDGGGYAVRARFPVEETAGDRDDPVLTEGSR